MAALESNMQINVHGDAKEHRRDSQRASQTEGLLDGGSGNEKKTSSSSAVLSADDRLKEERKYYQTFYDQFSNVIMIATFTGGVQAAVLAFLNDVLKDLEVPLFLQDLKGEGRTLYTVYSLGLMLGLLAVALNLSVAAIAAVNAALCCHFSLHPPIDKKNQPYLESRIVFCMMVQFIAFGVAGISLILLTVKFDIAFAIITAVLLFAGLAVSAYHIIALYGSDWFKKMRAHPLHAISLTIATATFVFEVVVPAPSAWFTITTYGMTVIYHMMVVLHNKSAKGDRPRRLPWFWVVILSVLWIGCAVVTRFLRHQSRWSIPVVCTLSGVEAATLLAIAIVDGPSVWPQPSPMER